MSSHTICCPTCILSMEADLRQKLNIAFHLFCHLKGQGIFLLQQVFNYPFPVLLGVVLAHFEDMGNIRNHNFKTGDGFQIFADIFLIHFVECRGAAVWIFVFISNVFYDFIGLLLRKTGYSPSYPIRVANGFACIKATTSSRFAEE